MVWYIGRATSTVGRCCTEPLGEKKHFCFQIIPPNLRPSSLFELKWGNPAKVTFPQEERLHWAAPDIILLPRKSSDVKKTALQSRKAPKK